jgi:hypothetical protein
MISSLPDIQMTQFQYFLMLLKICVVRFCLLDFHLRFSDIFFECWLFGWLKLLHIASTVHFIGE